jgi:hypothetical protein
VEDERKRSKEQPLTVEQRMIEKEVDNRRMEI